MNKRLLIMRHGQAEAALYGAADRQRSLTEQGREQSATVGKALKSRGIIPEIILSSQALRAVQTAKEVLVGLDFAGRQEIPLVQIEEFFTGMTDHFVAELGALPESMGTVMVVAHNPWLSDMVSVLTGEPIELAPGQVALLEAKERAEGHEWASVVTETGMWQLDSI